MVVVSCSVLNFLVFLIPPWQFPKIQDSLTACVVCVLPFWTRSVLIPFDLFLTFFLRSRPTPRPWVEVPSLLWGSWSPFDWSVSGGVEVWALRSDWLWAGKITIVSVSVGVPTPSLLFETWPVWPWLSFLISSSRSECLSLRSLSLFLLFWLLLVLGVATCLAHPQGVSLKNPRPRWVLLHSSLVRT